MHLTESQLKDLADSGRILGCTLQQNNGSWHVRFKVLLPNLGVPAEIGFLTARKQERKFQSVETALEMLREKLHLPEILVRFEELEEA
jgi:hypothetical protein